MDGTVKHECKVFHELYCCYWKTFLPRNWQTELPVACQNTLLCHVQHIITMNHYNSVVGSLEVGS